MYLHTSCDNDDLVWNGAFSKASIRDTSTRLPRFERCTIGFFTRYTTYLDHLEDSYVLFTLPVAERSLRKREVNPKKLHPIDWSLAYPFVPAPRVDVRRKLESAVFLHWRRRREDLGYLGGSAEIDLVVNRHSPERLVNVAYSLLEDSTWRRELRALDAGATRFLMQSGRSSFTSELGVAPRQGLVSSTRGGICWS